MKGDSISKADFNVASFRKTVVATSEVLVLERTAQSSSASFWLPGSIWTIATSGEGDVKSEAKLETKLSQSPELLSDDGFSRLKLGFAKIMHSLDADSFADGG